MGLTIHYKLRSPTRSPNRVRQLLTKLRSRALELPFVEVGEIIESEQPESYFERCDRDDDNAWFWIQAMQHVAEGRYSYRVAPSHVIGFDAFPGEGSEWANFGLCRYPAAIDVPSRTLGGTRRLATKLAGWSWDTFCKTEFACRPERGGVANFLKCHLLVVAMLDHARSLDILGAVDDEGDFWEGRDFEVLARNVGGWNEQTTDLLGRLKQLGGPEVRTEIFKLPEFQRLNAEEQAVNPANTPSAGLWLDGKAACSDFLSGRNAAA